ncbi:MAG: hypothetical protein C4297_08035 [Gemmataceae bacterium]
METNNTMGYNELYQLIIVAILCPGGPERRARVLLKECGRREGQPMPEHDRVEARQQPYPSDKPTRDDFPMPEHNQVEARQHSVFAVYDFLRSKYGWQCLDKLGEGGFNYVFRETLGGITRAVKISKSPLASEGRAELRGLDVAKDFNGHPRFVALIQYEEVLGHLVTVWELGQESLAQLLRRRQQMGQQGLSRKETIAYLAQVAEGLDFLNKNGVFHRDIKPENLILFPGNSVKICDLGLSKVVGISTASHSAAGTFGFTPPEAQRGELHFTCDLYGLAATYVKLRTGRNPFGTNLGDILERQKSGRPYLEGLDADEREYIVGALHPEAQRRPAHGCLAWIKQVWRGSAQAKKIARPVLRKQRELAPLDPFKVPPPPPERDRSSSKEMDTVVGRPASAEGSVPLPQAIPADAGGLGGPSESSVLPTPEPVFFPPKPVIGPGQGTDLGSPADRSGDLTNSLFRGLGLFTGGLIGIAVALLIGSDSLPMSLAAVLVLGTLGAALGFTLGKRIAAFWEETFTPRF